jgi:hypothetical protein
MGEIYCLYSSQNGVPRYVEATEWSADKKWKKHLTDALDLVSGQLYDWIRDVARGGHYVGFHTLQTDIAITELPFYEQYWVSQFVGLLNICANVDKTATPTDTANSVILAIKGKLARQHFEDGES